MRMPLACLCQVCRGTGRFRQAHLHTHTHTNRQQATVVGCTLHCPVCCFYEWDLFSIPLGANSAGPQSPVELIHEVGEYCRNVGAQSRHGADESERYFRQVQELVQRNRFPTSYFRDRSVGSPTPHAVATGSDNTSEISLPSEVSSDASRCKLLSYSLAAHSWVEKHASGM